MKSKITSAPDWSAVRSSANYRSFLKAYLDARSLSFSDFARATGFGRGFPSDVISGRRRLSARSARAFENALKIPTSGKKLFRCLVARDEPDLFPELKSDRLRKIIAELQSKPWNNSVRQIDLTTVDSGTVLRDPNAIAVFSASGALETGATFEQIAQRTRLSHRLVEAALLNLEKSKMIRYHEGRYYTQDLHAFMKTNGANHAFVELFRGMCSLASAKVHDSITSESEMFFSSTFCIDEKKMPELKKELRKTLLRFVDESINAEGDRTVRLLTGFFN